MGYYPDPTTESVPTAAVPVDNFYIMVTDSVKGANRPVRHGAHRTVSAYLRAQDHDVNKIKWFVTRGGVSASNSDGTPFNADSPLRSGDMLYVSAGSVKSGR